MNTFSADRGAKGASYLTTIFSENRFPSLDQVRGQAFLGTSKQQIILLPGGHSAGLIAMQKRYDSSALSGRLMTDF
jgi:hypothetical protein